MLASRERLKTVDARLAQIVERVAEVVDVTVLCGRRGKAEQDRAFAEGHSKVRWPNSKHNVARPDGTEDLDGLARAVDLAPYPIDWNDRERFILLAGHVLMTARVLGVQLVWGGDWNRNFSVRDERFQDLPHFELV